jgi:putative lipoprotein
MGPTSKAFIVILLCAAFAACGGKKETTADSTDSTLHVTETPDTIELPPETARGSAGEIFRGYLAFLPEGSAFQACGSDEKSWIVDVTSGELSKQYERLAINRGDPIFVEFRGTLAPPPGSGFGATYANQLTVLELRHAALEGPGCNENLQGLDFRARGNEPFWGVEIGTGGIVFSDFGRSLKLTFPYAAPAESPGRWRYASTTASDGEHRIVIDIERDSCMDSMSGAFFTYSAAVEVDGSPYVGCAMQGLR